MVNVNEEDTIPLILAPSEMSLHHVKVAHASNPNKSKKTRLGFAIRFISANVRKQKVQESALVVREQDSNHYFHHKQRPMDEFSLDGRLAHNRALQHQITNNYQTTPNTPLNQRMQLGLHRTLSQTVMDLGYCKLKTQTWIGHR